MSFVCDSCIALAWCIPDEHKPELVPLRNQALSNGIVVPSVWPFEVASVLGLAHRTNRLTSTDLIDALGILEQFEIEVVPPPDLQQFSSIWTTMQKHGLSAYDASYLSLALEQKVPLATLDKKLIAAAISSNVHLLV